MPDVKPAPFSTSPINIAIKLLMRSRETGKKANSWECCWTTFSSSELLIIAPLETHHVVNTRRILLHCKHRKEKKKDVCCSCGGVFYPLSLLDAITVPSTNASDLIHSFWECPLSLPTSSSLPFFFFFLFMVTVSVIQCHHHAAQ